MPLHLRDKDIVQDSAEHLPQGQADAISCSSLVHQHYSPATEATKLTRHDLLLAKPCWCHHSPLAVPVPQQLSVQSAGQEALAWGERCCAEPQAVGPGFCCTSSGCPQHRNRASELRHTDRLGGFLLTELPAAPSASTPSETQNEHAGTRKAATGQQLPKRLGCSCKPTSALQSYSRTPTVTRVTQRPLLWERGG